MCDNVGEVKLSDGRSVWVEADHNGEVRVTLVLPDRDPDDADLSNWGALGHRIRRASAYAAEIRVKAMPIK